MTQSILMKEDELPDGHHKHFKSHYDNGNLTYLRQRLDTGFIEGDAQYPAKAYLKTGKTKRDGTEFIEKITKEGKLEIPQQFWTAFPDIIKGIREDLLLREIKLRKAQGNYNFDYHMYEDVKAVARIHKDTQTP